MCPLPCWLSKAPPPVHGGTPMSVHLQWLRHSHWFRQADDSALFSQTNCTAQRITTPMKKRGRLSNSWQTTMRHTPSRHSTVQCSAAPPSEVTELAGLLKGHHGHNLVSKQLLASVQASDAGESLVVALTTLRCEHTLRVAKAPSISRECMSFLSSA